MTQGSVSIGPLVRLDGISIAQLPTGGQGHEPKSEAAGRAEAKEKGVEPSSTPIDFITSVLQEAIPFIDGVAPKSGSAPTWKSKGSPKRYASSDAPVHLFEHVVSSKEIDAVSQSGGNRDETWICRRSCHEDKATTKTASWEEFVHCFKDHHHETEDAFTETVIGAREAIRWDTTGLEATIDGETWNDLTLEVVEMTHRIDPKPLKNRTFPVIQVAGSLAGAQEFVVVSIPLKDFEKSQYSEAARDKSLVIAAYAAVERVRVLPESKEVEWIMATASDARGNLPQWMQNLAVPGKVAKDVDMFLSWIPSQRSQS